MAYAGGCGKSFFVVQSNVITFRLLASGPWRLFDQAAAGLNLKKKEKEIKG